VIRFSLLISGLALLVYAGISFAAERAWFECPSFAMEVLIFLVISHVATYGMSIRHMKGEPSNFVRIYLGLTVLRILFFGVFVFTILRMDHDGGTANALFFLCCYFLFTSVEVTALYRASTLRELP
jgi:hypothetical protein